MLAAAGCHTPCVTAAMLACASTPAPASSDTPTAAAAAATTAVPDASDAAALGLRLCTIAAGVLPLSLQRTASGRGLLPLLLLPPSSPLLLPPLLLSMPPAAAAAPVLGLLLLVATNVAAVAAAAEALLSPEGGLLAPVSALPRLPLSGLACVTARNSATRKKGAGNMMIAR